MDSEAQPHPNKIPKLEWIVAAFGFLIVGTMLAFLLRKAVAGDHSPPRIRVEVVSAEPEASEVTMAYLPAHSERRGGLFFQADPRAGSLTLHAQGYEEP